jgi:ppGpp synthetase/RelA/SpoT-type nucleotidyltranferase
MDENTIKDVLALFEDKKYMLEQLIAGVTTYFTKNPEVSPYVHTIKSRIKDPGHLVDKIMRKAEKGKIITKDNLFDTVTDLAGVRVLHLYPKEFDIIHYSLEKAIEEGQWKLYEDPIAFTWDPESKQHFEEMGLKTELRDTYYTSIHYVIKPNNMVKNSPCCEIQVRTLFEEIWGEIDHKINYPHPTKILSCKEQLRVLSKLVSTGTRLADSIYNCYNEGNSL